MGTYLVLSMIALVAIGCLWFGISLAFNPAAPSTASFALFSVSTALVCLAIFVYCIYALPIARHFYGTLAPAFLSGCVFVAMFSMYVFRQRPRLEEVFVAGVISVVVLFFVGFFTWLMVACSLGDCL